MLAPSIMKGDTPIRLFSTFCAGQGCSLAGTILLQDSAFNNAPTPFLCLSLKSALKEMPRKEFYYQKIGELDKDTLP